MKRIGLIIVVPILVAGVFLAFLKGKSTLKPMKTLSGDLSIQTKRLVTYSDERSGYEIRYPENLEVEQVGETSIQIKDPDLQDLVGPTNFVYVSFIPSLDPLPTWEIYNFSPYQLDMLLTGNKSLDLSETPGQSNWYTYTWEKTLQIDGKLAYRYTNKKPWEFPGGTTEVRYAIDTGNGYFLAGGYAQETSRINLETIKEMVESMEFTSVSSSSAEAQ